ncbi:MAG: FAD-dependent thymidylate synthase [Bacillota bacterium]
MVVIKPYFVIETDINGEEVLKHIEKAGRVCYKSEDRTTNTSAAEFVRKIIKNGHEAVIEHYSITVKVICDRGVTHEIVRHRLASYSQESTRYCNYGKDKFSNQITYIEPCFWDVNTEDGKRKYDLWKSVMEFCEKKYMELLEAGATPQEARSVLPNSLKTELVMTMNLREWRHFFKLRTAAASHPQMREIAVPLLNKFKELVPVVFDDIC